MEQQQNFLFGGFMYNHCLNIIIFEGCKVSGLVSVVKSMFFQPKMSKVSYAQ